MIRSAWGQIPCKIRDSHSSHSETQPTADNGVTTHIDPVSFYDR